MPVYGKPSFHIDDGGENLPKAVLPIVNQFRVTVEPLHKRVYDAD
jgi:hypothetical protein